ncbi:MAG: response regulator [Verrucomicrobiota bacterium]|nr:response regulator [Verrucomicrobiota bacterium]
MPVPGGNGSNQALIIIDDEPAIRELAQTALGMHGFRVYEASDGGEALEMIKKDDLDIGVAIVDLSLPDINGVELTGKLLQIRPELKIVISTGSDIADIDIDIRGIGAKGYIEKPYRMSDLLALVQDLMR